MLLYLLAVVIDEPALATQSPTAPPHIYLHPPADGCDSRQSQDEVVVCANRDQDRFRLHPMDDHKYEDAPVRAEIKVAGGTLALRAEARPIGNAQDDVYFRDVTTHSDLRLRFILPF